MTKMTALFAELARLDEQMSGENAHLTVRELTALDEKHTAVWDEIIDYRPANKEIAELMALMLLDKMQTMAARGESCMIVREKLLELFSESFSQPKRYITVAQGRGNSVELVRF